MYMKKSCKYRKTNRGFTFDSRHGMNNSKWSQTALCFACLLFHWICLVYSLQFVAIFKLSLSFSFSPSLTASVSEGWSPIVKDDDLLNSPVQDHTAALI